MIYRLGRSVYFAEESLEQHKGLGEFLHTENLILSDKKRHLRGLYHGLNKSSVNQLLRDIKMLQRQG